MKNKKFVSLAYFMALVFLIGIFGNNIAFAGSNRLVLELPKNEDLHDTLKKGDGSYVFKYWDISEDFSYSDDEEERNQIASELHKMSDSQLNEKYKSYSAKFGYEDGKLILNGIEDGLFYFRSSFTGQDSEYSSSFIIELPFNGSTTVNLVNKIVSKSIQDGHVKLIKVDDTGKCLKGVGFTLYTSEGESVPLMGNYVYSKSGKRNQILYTDDKGLINISGLPYGEYYFKEVSTLDGYKLNKNQAEFEIKDNQLIEVKVVNEKNNTGKFSFLKVSGDCEKNPLAGAKFKVTRLVDGKHEAVMKNGKELFVTSGEDGKFEVKHLAYGEYFLWEVKAPKGYKKLGEPIKFVINRPSNKTVMIIENKTEPKIPMPQSGDLLLPLLLVSSAGLFGTGYKLSKNDEE